MDRGGLVTIGRPYPRRSVRALQRATHGSDLSTLGVRFVRRLHIQSNRLPIATIYTALNVLVPFALGSAIVATSIVLVVVYVRPTTDGVTLIQERLLALAPTYTGQIDLAQLVPLLSPANELAGLVAPLQRLFKVVFSLYAGWVIAIYLVRRNHREWTDSCRCGCRFR